MTLRDLRKRLARLRLEQGWTVQAMADRISAESPVGVSVSQLHKILAGRSAPSDVRRFHLERFVESREGV